MRPAKQTSFSFILLLKVAAKSILILLTINNLSYAGNIPTSPPGKNFRTVIIYVKLANDEFELGNITTTGWPHTRNAPYWKDQLLIGKPYHPKKTRKLLAKFPQSITAFYYKMSGGKLWLYGDEIVYRGPALNRSNSPDIAIVQKQWQENNTKVMQWFVDHYDLSKLDNDNNEQPDCVILINRARPKFGFQGIADLQANPVLNKDRLPVKLAGIYQTDCYSLEGTRHIVTHELGHKLGIVQHINGLHRWNLMSGRGNKAPEQSGVTMSAYERYILGWLEYDQITDTAQNIVLGNLTEANKAIKIPLAESENYFVIENRQYSLPFEPRPDQTEQYTPTLPGTGLLVYYVDRDGPNILPADSNIRKVILGEHPHLQICYNGDDSDLYGNYGRTEVRLYENPINQKLKKIPTIIMIKNIHFIQNNAIFDVIFTDQLKSINPTVENPEFKIYNSPNPFKYKTRIYYTLPCDSHVRLELFQADQKVTTLIDQNQLESEYEFVLNVGKLPAGEYTYKLTTDIDSGLAHMRILRPDAYSNK